MEPKKSDASCFSPLANKQSDGGFRPECYSCGANAIGGELLKVKDEVYTIRFGCGNHGETFAITVSRIYPGWLVSAKMGGGIYKLVRARKEAP